MGVTTFVGEPGPEFDRSGLPAAPVATEPGCSHPECVLPHPHSGPAVLRAREDG